MNQIKSIKVSSITHKHLSRLGKKGETYEQIISKLIQEHLLYEMINDIKKIESFCKDEIVLKKNETGQPERIMSFENEVSKISRMFDKIDFDYGIYPDWKLKDAIEIASDEDMVGSGVAFGERDLYLSEIAINTYCLYLEMPSPTTGLGAMISPLAQK